MSALILPTDTPERLAAAIARAAAYLTHGEVVALPTETVYGLAADALDAAAVGRIYAAKGRPAHNPLIVHVADVAMARACARRWPALAERLATAFWPGPLSLVVPRAASIPDVVTAGGDTVALRWPRHPVFEAVIRACGRPLAAPSANRANALSPTTAAHVARDLGDRIPLIVDGGPCTVGIESTVVDVTGPTPRILRPGMITAEAVAAAVAADVARGATDVSGALRSPGQLARHYAPRARLLVASWADADDLARRLATAHATPPVHVLRRIAACDASRVAAVSTLPHDPDGFAQALYAALHDADAAGAATIVVERPPAGTAWSAIADRLRRAAAER